MHRHAQSRIEIYTHAHTHTEPNMCQPDSYTQHAHIYTHAHTYTLRAKQIQTHAHDIHKYTCMQHTHIYIHKPTQTKAGTRHCHRPTQTDTDTQYQVDIHTHMSTFRDIHICGT